MVKGSQITARWRALFAVTSTGQQPPRRRWLLAGTDIFLTLTVLVVIALLAGMLIRYGDGAVLSKVGGAQSHPDSSATAARPISSLLSQKSRAGETAADHAHLHMQPGYRCPRHPELLSSSPGFCPIDGERLLWYEGNEAPVAYLDKMATVADDQLHLKRVELFGAGWVDGVRVKVGDQVRQGQLLLEFYALDLIKGSEQPETLVRLYAPVPGTVRAIHVKEANYVANGTVAVEIEDSGGLWLKTAVTPEERARISVGQPVELRDGTASTVLPLGEVEAIAADGDDQDEVTVWLRFDGTPLPPGQAQANIRIHARGGTLTPPA